MASEKNERLVNLTIALLATKKFLTKSQIFKLVAGYEGSGEATDRMFERDKEELRALGIEIEMKSIDPLFDDEIGYRISPDKYRFDLGELSNEDVALLALASEAWKESALSDIALQTSIRLDSLGITADFSGMPLAPTIAHVPPNISEILDAIENRKIIEIGYLNSADIAENKKVAPLGIYSQDSRWYLFATDTAKNEERSYRLDRIQGDIKRTAKSFQPRAISLPKSHFPTIEAMASIRRDQAAEILANAEVLSEDDEWLLCRVNFKSENDAISKVLKYSPNVILREPIALVSTVTKKLNELVKLHGK